MYENIIQPKPRQGCSSLYIDCHAVVTAGLQQGDIIFKIGDVTLDETHSYINTLFTFKPGDQIPLGVMRDGKQVDLTITLGESSHN